MEINFSYGGNDWDFVGFKFLYTSDDLQLAEHHIYGSGANGRIAISKPSDMDYESSTITESSTFERILGEKYYELKDHLGNIRVTINDYKTTDKKTIINSLNTNYPFGMQMPGMNYQASNSRYGFGGHEGENEISGQGNHLAFGDFGAGTREVRRWNQDPVEMVGISRYVLYADNPIFFNDPDGRQTGFDLRLYNAQKAYMKGKMTHAELKTFYQAEAMGGLVGVVIVTGGLLAPELVAGGAVLVPAISTAAKTQIKTGYWRVTAGSLGTGAMEVLDDNPGASYGTGAPLADEFAKKIAKELGQLSKWMKKGYSKVGSKFSSTQYRKNLKIKTGKLGNGHDAHHTLPKNEKFSDFF